MFVLQYFTDIITSKIFNMIRNWRAIYGI